MFKVNLMKKMTAGKQSDSKETLALREAQELLRTEDARDAGTLKDLGMDHALRVHNKHETLNNFLSKYDKKYIFHISEIKKVCLQYNLKFLLSSFYRGHVDPMLPTKVRQFESNHLRHKKVKKFTRYDRGGEPDDSFTSQEVNYNYFIAAPKSSFELQENPKDPLFFADLGNDYFYLVHKWGDDLSITRRLITLTLYPILKGIVYLHNEIEILASLIFTGIGTIVLFALSLLLFGKEYRSNNISYIITFCIVATFISVHYVAGKIAMEKEWKSPFKD